MPRSRNGRPKRPYWFLNMDQFYRLAFGVRGKKGVRLLIYWNAKARAFYPDVDVDDGFHGPRANTWGIKLNDIEPYIPGRVRAKLLALSIETSTGDTNA